jgi:hypothetical protein
LFVVVGLGAPPLTGLERPLRLYRVIRPSGVRGRFQAATAAGGLTAFVGREDELRSLTSRWERVLDGEGQVALIIGEAGIGKSRLVQRFHEQIARRRIPRSKLVQARSSRTRLSIRSPSCCGNSSATRPRRIRLRDWNRG